MLASKRNAKKVFVLKSLLSVQSILISTVQKTEQDQALLEEITREIPFRVREIRYEADAVVADAAKSQ